MKTICFSILPLTILLLVVRSQEFSSERIGDTQFHVFLNPRTFDEAVVECQQIDENTQLASVRNEKEFNALVSFFQDNSISAIVFLGLTREQGTDGIDPLSFDFVDGFEDKSFIEVCETLPWSPNEASGSGGERCVIWHTLGSAFIEPNRWDDVSCGINSAFLCRTQLLPTDVEQNQEIILTVSLACVTAGFLVTVVLMRLFKKRTEQFRKSKLFLQEKQKNKKFKPIEYNYSSHDKQSTIYDTSTINTRTTISESGYTELQVPIQGQYRGY